jgi:hypothetical protein
VSAESILSRARRRAEPFQEPVRTVGDMTDPPHVCAGCHLEIAVDEDFVRAEPYTRTVVEQGTIEQFVYLPGELEAFHVACAPMRDHRYRILV